MSCGPTVVIVTLPSNSLTTVPTRDVSSDREHDESRGSRQFHQHAAGYRRQAARHRQLRERKLSRGLAGRNLTDRTVAEAF